MSEGVIPAEFCVTENFPVPKLEELNVTTWLLLYRT